MPQLNFNPKTDIPNLSGKVIFVTGGTAGLGRETILSLASHEGPDPGLELRYQDRLLTDDHQGSHQGDLLEAVLALESLRRLLEEV